MPSSTSSSELPSFERTIPDKGWLRLFSFALVVAALGTAAWELRVRVLGYGPTYGDTPNLWASQRARASGARREQVVFVGSSRTLFDMDLEVFRQETGGPLPIQQATVGSNPLPMLEELAADQSYAGTTIVGVVPGLLAAAGGPPMAKPQKYLAHYAAWSPAQRFELPLVLWLEDYFALINDGDLTLSALIGHADLPLRPGVYAPSAPGYLHTVSRVRQGRLSDFVAQNPEALRKVQQLWLPLFGGPPKPPIFTEEQWATMMAEGWTSNLARLAQSVQQIEARGGRVLFSRLPSTGAIRALELKNTPRALFWDRLLRETGSPGIHFEDHPELQGFDCPEWSHLGGEDATEYTRRFARILKRQGLL